MKKGLNIKVNINTIVELTKKKKALEGKVKLLERENKRLQKKANEMEWGRLTDEP